MQEKIEKIFFDFEIIAFELFPLDTRFYRGRILENGCSDMGLFGRLSNFAFRSL